MKVAWNYDGSLTYNHTTDEVEDVECHTPQTVSPLELIVHAANLHLFRTNGHTPSGVPLWSVERRAEPVLPGPRSLPTP